MLAIQDVVASREGAAFTSLIVIASRDSTAECSISWMFMYRSVPIIVRDRP
jgi:hypothetical protein